MQFLILGPLDVRDESDSIALGGPKQRALIAVLLLNHPESVSSARLVDALWGERPPPTAAKTVQVMVSRLRRALGEGVLVSRAGGYTLAIEADVIDRRRFEELVAQGRARLEQRDPEGARELLGAALALWRGPVLEDIAFEQFVQDPARGLEELRVRAVEHRVEADLALGRHAELVAELSRLVRQNPLHERLHAQLMLALYGAGRQADALEAFQAARRTLLEEVGLEPGPELRALQERILAHDPTLLPPTGTSSDRARPRPTRRRTIVSVAIAAAAAVAVAAVAMSGSGERPEAPSILRDSLAALDPATGRVEQALPVGAGPVAVTVGEGAVWVASAGEQTLERVDPGRRRITGRVGLGRLPSAVAAGEGALWVTSAVGRNGSVARVEPGSASVVRTTTVRPGAVDGDDFAPHTPSAVAVGLGGAWTNRGRERVVRVAVNGGRVQVLRLAPSHSVDGIAVGEGSVWVASSADDRVLRIDPRRMTVRAAIPIASRAGSRLAGPYGIAAGAGAVWVADALANAVSRIDPGLDAVTATIAVGARPTHVAIGGGAVWVLNAGDGTVMRIDPRTNRVTATTRLPNATGLAAGAGAVWVTVAGGSATGRAPVSAAPVTPVAVSGCSPMRSKGGADVLVVSDLPTWLGGRRAPVTRDMRRAIRAVLEARGYRAGRHRVGYQACDDSERRDGSSTPARCAANARAYATTQRLVGVIGPYHSYCTTVSLPILNAAPTGPVAMVSPSNTYAGLTRAGPATAADEPDRFYPTRVRSYVRTVMPDHGQAKAIASLASQLRIRRLFLLDDAQGTGYALGRYVRGVAADNGVAIAGAASWTDDPIGDARLAARVARAQPDGVLLAGCFCTGGHAMLRALRARLPASTTYIGSDAMMAPATMFPRPHQATEGMYMTAAGLAPRGAGARARSLLEGIREDGRIDAIEPYVLEAATATEVLIDALARSDGSRASVVNALRRTHLRGGFTGELAFDHHGDPTRGRFTVWRVSRDAPPEPQHEVAGLVYNRTIEVAQASP